MKRILLILLFPIVSLAAIKPYIESVDIIDVPGKPGYVRVIVHTADGPKTLELTQEEMSLNNDMIELWLDRIIGSQEKK